MNAWFQEYIGCGHGSYLFTLVNALRVHGKGLEVIPFTIPARSFDWFLPSAAPKWHLSRWRSVFMRRWYPRLVHADVRRGYPKKRWHDVVWETIGLPMQARRSHVALLHNPYWTVPWPLMPCPATVVTVHDVIPLMDRPDFKAAYRSSRSADAYYRYLAGALGTVNRIVCDTRAAADDVIRLTSAVNSRVEIVRLAPDPYFRQVLAEDERNATLSAYGYGDLSRPMVVTVGSGMDFRKNIARLVGAFVEHSDVTNGARLVVVGDLHHLAYPASKYATPMNVAALPSNVTFTGYLSRAGLRALYQAACLCVFPSLAEGGGLAVLEAMASGAPVIVSDIPVFHEVCGERAALYVDPLDKSGLAHAIHRVLHDTILRQELTTAALERSQVFEAERMALEMIEIYDMVGASQ